MVTILCSCPSIFPSLSSVNLYLENEQGEFEKIEGRGPDFFHRTNFVFYASLGSIDDFERSDEAYPGGQSIRVLINFDDYPWEIGVQITRTRDGEVIWYRPPRYYAHEVRDLVAETVSIPSDKADNYTVTIGDTYGDGLGIGATYVRVTTDQIGGQELGSTSFDTGSTDSFSFIYDPATMALAPPPTAPTSASFAKSMLDAVVVTLVPIALVTAWT